MRTADTPDLGAYHPSTLTAEPIGRVFRSRLPNVATEIQLASDTAYFVYVGRTAQPIRLQYVEFYVSTAGTGTNTVEVGLFSTLLGPNGTDQALTKPAVAAAPDIDT